MTKDNEIRKAAEEAVLKVRGSYDAPGFEACVEAEIKEMTRDMPDYYWLPYDGNPISKRHNGNFDDIGLFKRGDLVKKKGAKGQWHGRVCGFYETEITPVGYAVESLLEAGSVQIYPESELEEWDGSND